jgi:multimeric flavodoxin WrbA
MSRIVVICGSPRKKGNTEELVRMFAKGAAEHNDVEIIYVRDKKINYCIGCDHCKRKEGVCIHHDDMLSIYEKLKNADVLILASPVYFYGISSQLKTVIDRLHNPIRDTFHLKKLGLILVGADTLSDMFDSIITQYELSLRYFSLEDAGRLLVRGAAKRGDVFNTTGPQEAFQFGKSLESST